MNRALLGSLLLGFLIAACGNTDDPSPGSGGAPGEGAGGEGGGAPVACGGSEEATCGEGELCEHPDGRCGAGAEQGQCVARPAPRSCPERCTPVCGCDSKVYCNECLAHAAGVNVSNETTCIHAYYETGGSDALSLYKADVEDNRCTRIVLVSPHENEPNEDVALPVSWGVSRLNFTGRAVDCGFPFPDDARLLSADVDRLDGSVSWDDSPTVGIPCTLDVDITITFADGVEDHHLRATSVPIYNGCL
ncbi:uncharacterized protein SOCEGT47_044750 [Sorangium cellulosum]|uniref:Kazal-like domain-containing protein n=1 Tax=Sorangium cellulosum TaxID=56 RepID=A0A4P2Q3N5_SORCE|nr:hypothetical protein [Sorangium cellulosum]AUX23944.1 uncharacterized protein SOCEGT47_044750 [Sorangium cellulosum]